MPLKKADIIGRRICHVYSRLKSETVDDEGIRYPVSEAFVVLDDGSCLLFLHVDIKSNRMPFELLPALPAGASEVSVDPGRLDAPIAEIIYSIWPTAGLLLENGFYVCVDISGMPTPGGVIAEGPSSGDAATDEELYVWQEGEPIDFDTGMRWLPK